MFRLGLFSEFAVGQVAAVAGHDYGFGRQVRRRISIPTMHPLFGLTAHSRVEMWSLALFHAVLCVLHGWSKKVESRLQPKTKRVDSGSHRAKDDEIWRREDVKIVQKLL